MMPPHRTAQPQDATAPTNAGSITLTPEAFDSLYRQSWPSIVDYLRFRIGPADAADVAADVFVRAWAARGQYDPARGGPSTWLWGIARNAARDWFRGPIARVEPLAEDIATDAGLPEQGVRAEAMARVAAAVAQLEPIDRDIIALRFGGGLSNREVGQSVGLSEAAAATRLHRAIKRLRVSLEVRVSLEGSAPQ